MLSLRLCIFAGSLPGLLGERAQTTDIHNDWPGSIFNIDRGGVRRGNWSSNTPASPTFRETAAKASPELFGLFARNSRHEPKARLWFLPQIPDRELEGSS